MPTSRTDSRVKCPFYKYDESHNKKNTHRIACEGLTDDSTLMLVYTYKRDFRIQLETFCCEHYKKCEIYRMVAESKYEENNI